MKITDAVNDLQLLSNLGDLAVAGTAITGTAVDSADVDVMVAGETILDEVLYSDEDGTVWIRDVKALLKPYINPASVVEVEVETNDGETDYSFNVFYCLAEIVKNSSTTNLDMLRENFLTSVNKKKVWVGDAESVTMFGYYDSFQTIDYSMSALYSVDGGSPTIETLEESLDFEKEAVVQALDVSPSYVLSRLSSELSVDQYRLKLYGYKVFLTNNEDASMSYIVSDEKAPLRLKFENAFGIEETIDLFGSETNARDYDVTNAKMTGRLQRIDSQLTASHTFTLPLANDNDSIIAESVIMSQLLKIFDELGEWRGIVITDYSHETDSQLASENSIQFTWQWQTNDHRAMRLPVGAEAQNKLFNSVFTKQFN